MMELFPSSRCRKEFLQWDASQLPKASTGPAGVPSFRIPLVPQLPSAVTLYDQYNNAGTTGTSSQDFETALNAFDSFTADDFVVPEVRHEISQKWTYRARILTALPVALLLRSMSFFIRRTWHLPGTLAATRTANTFTGTTDFVITLTSAVTCRAPTGSQCRPGWTLVPAVSLPGRIERFSRIQEPEKSGRRFRVSRR